MDAIRSQTGLEEELRDFFREASYRVISAYLFGSHVAGRTWAESDVDVAVLLEESDPGRQTDLVLRLAEDLQRRMGRGDVDVVCLNGDRDGFAYEVLRTGHVVFCRDPSRRARFEAETYQRHFDRMPQDEICRRYLLERIRQRRMMERTPDMIDRVVIEKLLAYIQEMLHRLRLQQGKSLAEFEGDFLSVDAALHEMQTMLEAVSDIAIHLVAGGNLGTPTDRPMAVDLLAQHQILPRDLADRITQAVRMRNILVHHYPGVNLRKVYEAVQNDLGDIVDFCAEVVAYLDRCVPDPDAGSGMP